VVRLPAELLIDWLAGAAGQKGRITRITRINTRITRKGFECASRRLIQERSAKRLSLPIRVIRDIGSHCDPIRVIRVILAFRCATRCTSPANGDAQLVAMPEPDLVRSRSAAPTALRLRDRWTVTSSASASAAVVIGRPTYAFVWPPHQPLGCIDAEPIGPENPTQ
jgi:hypothetical protein